MLSGTMNSKIGVLALASILCTLQAQGRIWTNSTGKTIEGDFISASDTTVAILIKTNDKPVEIPLGKLSEADQQFVKEAKSTPRKKWKQEDGTFAEVISTTATSITTRTEKGEISSRHILSLSLDDQEQLLNLHFPQKIPLAAPVTTSSKPTASPKKTDKLSQKEKEQEAKNSLLIKSIQKEDEKAAIKLLDEGADVNAKDTEYNQTPLYWAAAKGNIAICKLLLARGAQTNTRALTPRQRFNDTNTRDEERAHLIMRTQEPLIPAVHARNPQLVELLLKNGAYINARDCFSNTALHYARDAEIARILIENGASIHAKNNSGCTPLHTLLFEVSQKGSSTPTGFYIQVATLLLENGADVNNLTYNGIAPLHGATDTAVIDFLLGAGANINIASVIHGYSPLRIIDGSTPLHWAAGNKNHVIVDLLLSRGADATIKDKMGNTARDIVLKLKNSQLVEIFRKHSKIKK